MPKGDPSWKWMWFILILRTSSDSKVFPSLERSMVSVRSSWRLRWQDRLLKPRGQAVQTWIHEICCFVPRTFLKNIWKGREEQSETTRKTSNKSLRSFYLHLAQLVMCYEHYNLHVAFLARERNEPAKTTGRKRAFKWRKGFQALEWPNTLNSLTNEALKDRSVKRLL